MTAPAVVTPAGALLVPHCPFCSGRHVHGGGGAVVGARLPLTSHCLRGAREYVLEVVCVERAVPA